MTQCPQDILNDNVEPFNMRVMKKDDDQDDLDEEKPTEPRVNRNIGLRLMKKQHPTLGMRVMKKDNEFEEDQENLGIRLMKKPAFYRIMRAKTENPDLGMRVMKKEDSNLGLR